MKYQYVLIILLSILSIENCTTNSSLNSFIDNVSIYNKHLEDLKNIDSYGYKSNYKSIDIQGALQATGNVFDLAIEGEGFFKVYDEKQKKIFYTRNGEFKIDPKGRIINTDLYILLPEIILEPAFIRDTIIITQKGILIYKTDINDKKCEELLDVYKPVLTEKYIKEGIYYEFSDVIKADEYKIIHKFLEMSNIDIVHNILNMRMFIETYHSEIKNADTKIKIIDSIWDYYKNIQELYTINKIMEDISGNIVIENKSDTIKKENEFINVINSLLKINNARENESSVFITLNNFYEYINTVIPFLAINEYKSTYPGIIE